MLRATTFLIMLSLFPLLLYSQQPEDTADTSPLWEDFTVAFENTGWRYHAGDSISWASPDFNERGWKRKSPEDIDELTADDFPGVGWFRIRFRLDSAQIIPGYVLKLQHKGASEVYLDGRLLRKFGQVSASAEEIRYFNPFNLNFSLPVGDTAWHVLAIRYANPEIEEWQARFEDNSTGFELEAAISGLEFREEYSKVILSLVGVMLMAFLFALGLVHFILFLSYRSQQGHLYSSIFLLIFSLVIAVTVLLNLSPNPKLSMIIRDEAMGVMVFLFFLSILLLLNKLFYPRVLKSFWIIAGLGFVASVGIIFESDDFFMLLLFAFAILLPLESFRIIIRSIIKKKPNSIVIGLGTLIFLILLLIPVISALFGRSEFLLNNKAFFLVVLAMMSIPISITVYLARQYWTLNNNLRLQLRQVQELSEKNLAQEREKQQLIQGQNERLEAQIAERTQALRQEKDRAEELLLNILPASVAEELKANGLYHPRLYQEVTVMFADFKDFTLAAERLSPEELVQEIDNCFRAFDEIISRYGIEKIKTIGDAYLCVSGLPDPAPDHALKIVEAAKEMQAWMKRTRLQHDGAGFHARIGVHTGPVIAGVVGIKKFQYDIWGDTVNTAARMEEAGEADQVNISGSTYKLINGRCRCQYRGEIPAKNKGNIAMYFVETDYQHEGTAYSPT